MTVGQHTPSCRTGTADSYIGGVAAPGARCTACAGPPLRPPNTKKLLGRCGPGGPEDTGQITRDFERAFREGQALRSSGKGISNKRGGAGSPKGGAHVVMNRRSCPPPAAVAANHHRTPVLLCTVYTIQYITCGEIQKSGRGLAALQGTWRRRYRRFCAVIGCRGMSSARLKHHAQKRRCLSKWGLHGNVTEGKHVLFLDFRHLALYPPAGLILVRKGVRCD